MKTLKIHCPKCGKYIQPVAELTELKYAAAPLGRVGHYVVIDYERLDISGNYEYKCPSCEQVIATSIGEIQNIYDGEEGGRAGSTYNPPNQPRCQKCGKFMRKIISTSYYGMPFRLFTCSNKHQERSKIFIMKEGRWMLYDKSYSKNNR